MTTSQQQMRRPGADPAEPVTEPIPTHPAAWAPAAQTRTRRAVIWCVAAAVPALVAVIAAADFVSDPPARPAQAASETPGEEGMPPGCFFFDGFDDYGAPETHYYCQRYNSRTGVVEMDEYANRSDIPGIGGS